MVFASYRITPHPGIAAGTEIVNTAAIYFDNNDPVITNSTLHTIFDCAAYGSNISTTLTGLCDKSTIHATSDVMWTEEFQWLLDEEIIGTDADVSIDHIGRIYAATQCFESIVWC